MRIHPARVLLACGGLALACTANSLGSSRGNPNPPGRGPSRPAPGPEVFEMRSGELEVRFPNRCIVYYDDRVRRIEQRSVCRPRQLRRADDAVAAFRREREQRPGPRVVARRRGAIDVRFANGCVVGFDALDRATGNRGRCRPGQLRRAERALVDERRERARARGRLESLGRGEGTPQAIARREQIQLLFENGCAFYYSPEGVELRRLSLCGPGQARRAERGIERYLQRRARRDPPRERFPRIESGPDGARQVLFRNGCVVFYDAEGQRTGSDPGCRRGQLRRAEREITTERRRAR